MERDYAANLRSSTYLMMVLSLAGAAAAIAGRGSHPQTQAGWPLLFASGILDLIFALLLRGMAALLKGPQSGLGSPRFVRPFVGVWVFMAIALVIVGAAFSLGHSLWLLIPVGSALATIYLMIRWIRYSALYWHARVGA